MTDGPDTFQDALDNHAAWLESGETMLAVADVIWAELARLSDEHRREIAAMTAAAEAGNPPPGTQWLDGRPVFTLPRAKMIPLMGCSDAYLMNAGYAVENFLKALRVKRLSIAGTSAAYARVSRIEVGIGYQSITNIWTLLARNWARYLTRRAICSNGSPCS